VRQELELLQSAQEDQFTMFEQRFDEIATELTTLKAENSELKSSKQRLQNQLHSVAQERDDILLDHAKDESEKVVLQGKILELESSLRRCLEELGKYKEMHKDKFHPDERRLKMDERIQMAEDIKGLISNFKEAKRQS
jgi:chromosome segregation ATPase